VLAALPEAELWMVSDHVEPAPGISWLQHPTDEELRELYRRATVFCLPSSYEGLGIPYLEAMAAGTPVIASDNPGACWILEDGGAGAIVADDQLGATLVGLLRDPIARDRLRAEGLRRAQDFSWDAVNAAHIEAYAQAISKRRRKGRRIRGTDRP
jgi:glycosyltransferase involved in cell wall biosynthesis